MDINTIRKTKIYQEFEKVDAKNTFEFTIQKFIQHIDTFYYAVIPCADWSVDSDLKKRLRNMRETAEKTRESVQFFGLDVFMNPNFAFGFYKYHLGLQDCYDIFIAESVPNESTPPIIIQLRSQYIWCTGIHKAIEQSVNCVREILSQSGFEIKDIQENRIDYAFHTNYIQDHLNFFSENNLSQMQISNFRRWHKEGIFFNDETYCDYFTLGRRKSNNVFFRTYNKTKEVIELGYKQFFIMIWLLNGMISHYDAHIMAECFEKGSYSYKEKARCLYYLEYGSDEEYKQQIQLMLDNSNTPMTEYKKIADELVPDITIITNIEFQTKRKFYNNLKLPEFVSVDVEPYMRRLKNLLIMQQSILDLLTYDVIRFVKFKGEYGTMRRDLRPVADWWNRLRSCKAFECDDITVDLFREYQTRLDIKKAKQSTMQKIATVGLYFSKADLDNEKHDFQTDLCSLITNMNDNDIENFYNYRHKKKKEISAKFSKIKKKGEL